MSAKRPEDVAPRGGTGVLLCKVCDKPIKTHKVGARCPQWDGILNSRISAEFRNNSVGRDAERKRRWRAANPGKN